MEQAPVRRGLQVRNRNISSLSSGLGSFKKPVLLDKANTKGHESENHLLAFESLKSSSKASQKSKHPSTLFDIYEDDACDCRSKVSQESGTQTDNDVQKHLHELMCSDNEPPEYWKVLADKRAEALLETLAENEELHSLVQNLREENYRLKLIADQAEYFADMYQELKTAQSTDMAYSEPDSTDNIAN